jgi:ferredoxin
MRTGRTVLVCVLIAVLASCLQSSDPVGDPPEFDGTLLVDTGWTDQGDHWKYGHLSSFTLHWDCSEDADEYQVRIFPAPITIDNWDIALSAVSVPGYLDSCLVPLVTEVYANTCISCGLCVDVCPRDAVTLTPGGVVIDPDECTACGQCYPVCPVNAVADSRFNQYYYFAVRAISEAGVPSEEIVSSDASYLMTYRNDEEWCSTCNDGTTSTCWIVLAGDENGCPVDAIYWDEEFMIYIDYDLCVYCGNCFDVCREEGLATICKYVTDL